MKRPEFATHADPGTQVIMRIRDFTDTWSPLYQIPFPEMLARQEEEQPSVEVHPQKSAKKYRNGLAGHLPEEGPR